MQKYESLGRLVNKLMDNFFVITIMLQGWGSKNDYNFIPGETMNWTT